MLKFVTTLRCSMHVLKDSILSSVWNWHFTLLWLKSWSIHKKAGSPLTVFLTGLDRHWIMRRIPPLWVMIAAFAGSVEKKRLKNYQVDKKLAINILREITFNLNLRGWSIIYRLEFLNLPAHELHIPPIPNSTSFSFGSVTQSRKSSKTLSCFRVKVELVEYHNTRSRNYPFK